LSTLASLLGNERGIEIKIIDGSVDPVPLDENIDLVGISVLTGTAPAAYRIADHYRRRGIPVVLGGVHVTILPGEAIRHADSIVIGMAERSWPRLIGDFRRGSMAAVYADDAPATDWIAHVPAPRRDLIRRSGYMMPDSVHATRGCRRACDFCSVPVVWPRYFKRPIGDVVADIKSIPGRLFCFNDVSLVDDLDYARELFTALIPLRKKWGGLATVEIANHPDLLDVMRRGGCVYLLLGFESVNQSNLRDMRKGFNRANDYRRVMDMLHGHGITVQGCFVFGLDDDDRSIFARTVEQVLDLKVDIPRYSLYTPYPGTALFKRMVAENRILSFNWEDYDTMHVVIEPKQMTPQELYDGFKRAYRETFRYSHILRRVAGLRLTSAVNFIGNLTYRIFVRRLYHEPRYAQPYSLANPCAPPDDSYWADAFMAQREEGRVLECCK
ncbi:B12-binding domain-containing radical SAM protein, partial [bacterium]|nr:B12-binding domain-containing radical SAM protein [bacterium]